MTINQLFKKAPSMDKTAFFTDAEYTSNKKVIDEAFNKIPRGKTIVVPKDNLGTGRAQLKTKAPKTWLYLQEKLKDLKKLGVDFQKNQTEGGEKSFHGVESTPVGSGVQIPSETSSWYLVGLNTC